MIHYYNNITKEQLLEIVDLMVEHVFDNWSTNIVFDVKEVDNETHLAIYIEDDDIAQREAMSISMAFIQGYALGKGIELYS
jgi:hypothetical protein